MKKQVINYTKLDALEEGREWCYVVGEIIAKNDPYVKELNDTIEHITEDIYRMAFKHARYLYLKSNYDLTEADVCDIIHGMTY